MDQRRWKRVSTHRLLTTYMIAIGLTAAMILAGYALNLHAARQGLNDEEAINISGRQRMLSQRIVLVARRYEDTQFPHYQIILRESLEAFESGHIWLTDLLVEGSPVWAHYFDPAGRRLDAKSKRFIALASDILEAQAIGQMPTARLYEIEALAIVELLADLNEAVSLFEAAANDRAAFLERLQFWAMLAAIALICIKTVFIFAPAHRQLAGTIRRLQEQAEVDALTGLSNRRHFIGCSQEALAHGSFGPDHVFLLALDLDGFKQINDTLGHPAGDSVLCNVAGSLRRILQETRDVAEYVIARPGGDEFLILGLVDHDRADETAKGVAQTLIATIEKPIPVSIGEGRVTECIVGVSIGIALGRDTGPNVDLLITNGDIALYESKRLGKGVATAFRDKMREESERRHRLNVEVKRGLQEFEFVPFFQPQIDIETGRVIGFEALARWHHPTRGLIGPAEFMDQVETAHKTDMLDGQIILQAVQTLKSMRDQGFAIGHMSVNASGTLLRDPQFADMFSQIIAAHGLKTRDFTVEVLENIVLDTSEDEAVSSIQRLKKAGFAIAVDDFGTGYSSLESVAKVGGSILKIDKSLVLQSDDPKIGKLLAASVALGHGLGSKIYAEGVETPDHLHRLKALGAEVAQGYLISRPLPHHELTEWMNGIVQTSRTSDLPKALIWTLGGNAHQKADFAAE